MTCENCGATGENFGKDTRGKVICCPACLFNPLGCRCKYGEYGVSETYTPYDDPDYDFEDEEDCCPECGSDDVSISEVYELGLTLWCYSCKNSFRWNGD